MNAVDTNVVVRLFLDDDAAQVAAVKDVFAGPVWISKTVLLETAWVLKSEGFDAVQIRHALGSLVLMPNATIEDAPAVLTALKLASEGVDVADALHVVSRPADAPFLTFDRALVRRAARAEALGVRTPDSKT